MNQESKYWDKISQRFAKHTIVDKQAYEHELAKTQEYFTPESKVLEIGCGTGTTALRHAHYVKHYHAIDFSTEMIKIAKSKQQHDTIDKLRFETAAIDEIHINEPLDVILALSVLHLINNLDKTINKIHNCLKPEGIFISSTVCLADGLKYFKQGARALARLGKTLGLLPNVEFFSKSDLKNILQTHGFQVIYEWQAENKATAPVFIIAKKLTGTNKAT